MDRWIEQLDVVAANRHDNDTVNGLVDHIFSGLDEVGYEVFRAFLSRSADGQTIHDFFIGAVLSDVSSVASWIPNARFDIVEGGHQHGVGGTLETRQMVLDFFIDLQQKGRSRNFISGFSRMRRSEVRDCALVVHSVRLSRYRTQCLWG